MSPNPISPQTIGWKVSRTIERRIILAGLLVIAFAAIVFSLANKYWPYRYRNVKPLLETVFASQVTIGNYHRIYFPHPGFVADGLILRRNSAQDLPPIGSTQQLLVEGNWLDLLLLRQRIRLVDVKGLHVVIPPVGSRANHEDFPAGSSADFAGPSTIIEQLHIHDSLLDILRVNGGRYSFPIHELTIRNLRNGQAISYIVDMENARPDGRIQASGSFGPLTPSNLGGTPLSGDFVYSQVHLDQIGELHGLLSAQGHFQGRLADIETNATASTGNFAVNNGVPARIAGTTQCTINGLNADVILHTIEVKTGGTIVHAGGSIMGDPKITDLDLDVENGRAEDLLSPFMPTKPPMVGAVWLKSHAHIAHEGKTFLQRLAVTGRFDVPAERLTDPATQQSLAAFSARASGEDPKATHSTTPGHADTLSGLGGPVTIRNGLASSTGLRFDVPGASVQLKGNYNLVSGAVHLTGNLAMQTDVSHVTTGVKAVLLKPLDPLFKRKRAGAVVPIAVTGTPNHYQVSQDIFHLK